jgi:hypothetical protein
LSHAVPSCRQGHVSSGAIPGANVSVFLLCTLFRVSFVPMGYWVVLSCVGGHVAHVYQSCFSGWLTVVGRLADGGRPFVAG